MKAALTFALIALAIFAPLVAPFDPARQSWTAVRKPPSWLYLFGTDESGRDLLSRIIYGAQISILVASFSVTTIAYLRPK